MFSIKKDVKKAINYYTRAKGLNLPRASNNLGVLYLNSKNESDGKNEGNTNETDKKIMSYLQEAQTQGFGQAYYNLGVVMTKGLAGAKNPEGGLKMFYEGGLKEDYKCKLKFAYELMNQTSIMKEEYEDHYLLAIHWL